MCVNTSKKDICKDFLMKAAVYPHTLACGFLLCYVSLTFTIQCAPKLLTDFVHPVIILQLKVHRSSSSLFDVVTVRCCCTDPYFLLTFCCSTVRQWHISCHTSTFHASKGCISSSLKQAFKPRQAFKVHCDKRTEEELFTYWCSDKLWLCAAG